jgi:hypothetical protein
MLTQFLPVSRRGVFPLGSCRPKPVPKTCTSVKQRAAKDMSFFAIDIGEENGYTAEAPQGEFTTVVL